MRIRSVKPELRVLGLSCCSLANGSFACLGVIIRPPHWVEGVIGGVYQGEKCLQNLSADLRNSSKFDQVRVVIADEGLCGSETLPNTLSQMLGKPIITLRRNGSWKASGLENRLVGEVFALLGNNPPEPIRVSRALCRAVAYLVSNKRFKARQS